VQAASGVGEPFVSAAGILGVMAIWRTYYAGFLESFFLSYDAPRSQQPEDQGRAWSETIAIVLALTCAAGAAVAAMHIAAPASL
jgi:hypothetical protein